MSATSQNKELFEDYDGFCNKFKAKKTTDDCYTPPAIYEAVKDYFVNKYNLQNRPIVRPFMPGGDYEHFDYPDNCVVIDNPPFSIISKIYKWYNAHNIDFVLFAPHLHLLGSSEGNCRIITDFTITYENGARVNTAFVTNIDKVNSIILDNNLHQIIINAQGKRMAKERRKIEYPYNVFSAATLGKFAKRQYLEIKQADCKPIKKLATGKIFGGGVILADEVVKQLITDDTETI